MRELGTFLFLFNLYLVQSESKNERKPKEYFSSAKEMEKLYETEETLIGKLEQIIEEKKQTVFLLERELEQYKKWHRDITAQDYAKNPICVFTMIKRLLYDWEKTMRISSDDWGDTFNELGNLPSLSDLYGAAESIYLIQLGYNIQTKDLANGAIKDHKLPHPMSGSDRLELAKTLFKLHRYSLSEEWLLEASLAYKEGAPEIRTMLEYLAVSACKTGHGDVAELYLEYLNALEPNADHLPQEDLKNYTNIIYEDKCVKEEKNETNIMYLKMCRYENGFKTKAVWLPKFSCYYVSDSPFLKIAPLKMEEYYLDPYVRYYHNVISDKEIETLINTTEHGMIRARVEGDQIRPVRKSKVRWIREEELEAINSTHLTDRIKDMTGLSLTYSENLQLNNYGPGGEYKPHNDNVVDRHGDRMTTVMFYLSDVEYGGATVFTKLGLTVTPRKGDALVWNNVLNDGKPDKRLLHSGCPVVIGSKWVLNKWIQYDGETFTWPCKVMHDK